MQEKLENIFFKDCIVQMNCSSDLKIFTKSQPSYSNFQKIFSMSRTIFSHRSSEQYWPFFFKALLLQRPTE